MVSGKRRKGSQANDLTEAVLCPVRLFPLLTDEFVQLVVPGHPLEGETAFIQIPPTTTEKSTSFFLQYQRRFGLSFHNIVARKSRKSV